MANKASNNTFEFVGKLAAAKATEKFNPYSEIAYDSGWVNRSLKFNVICGSNRHMVEVKGGCWGDSRDNSVKTLGIKADGKYPKITIPWNERNNAEQIAKVAEFKRFVLDIEKRGRRYELESLLKAFDNGDVKDEQLAKFGISSEREAADLLDKSNGKRKEFITEWDYAEAIYRIINSNRFSDCNFVVKGNIEITEYNGKFYTHYNVNRIYLADSNAEPKSEASMVVTFGRDAINNDALSDKGCYYIDAKTFCYDGSRKDAIPCNVRLELPMDGNDKQKAIGKLLLTNFTIKRNDVPYKELGVKIEVVNGAEKQEITEDMLSENERQLLAIGAMTMEELTKEHGSTVYGERIRKNVIRGFAYGWLSGARDTMYTDETFDLSLYGEGGKKYEQNEYMDSKYDDTKESEDILDDDLDDLLGGM